MEALLRCFEAESLAGSIVQRSSDGVAAMLRDLGHAGAFGDVLANQAVGVFVGAALPRMMRGREEETDSGSALELNVVVELGAVVSGDRFEVVRVPTHEPQSPSIGVFVGSGSELADQDVTGFAIDECHEAMLIARADDGVDFPVADLRAKLGGEGALADVSFAGAARD